MTTAAEALKLATAEVARVIEFGETKLNFYSDKYFRALEILPDNIYLAKNVTELNLNNTQVSDINAVSDLTALERLNLNNTQVSDINAVSDLTALERLYLDNTQVSDINAMSGLAALRVLFLTNTQVSNIDAVSALTALRVLSLNNTLINDNDIDAISGLSALEGISLSNTQVSDISAVSGLLSLSQLYLANTQVSDLRPIKDFTSFKTDSSDLSFDNTPATRIDPELDRLSNIENSEERIEKTLAYLKTLKEWPPKNDPVDRAIDGPILSESIADIEKLEEQFEAVAPIEQPEIEKDDRHEEFVTTLRYACQKLSVVEAENRLPKVVSENFRDYGNFLQDEKLNARLLSYIADMIRGALNDDISGGLDGFDLNAVKGFLNTHDGLVREYYPNVMHARIADVETSVETLTQELPAKIAQAKELLKEAENDRLFGPSVTAALEALEHRLEGATKTIATSTDPEAVEKAEEEVKRTAVLTTAYLGRITGRLKQWVKKQTDFAKENPGNTVLTGNGLVDLAQKAIENITPIFHELWALLGTIPLPF